MRFHIFRAARAAALIVSLGLLPLLDPAPAVAQEYDDIPSDGEYYDPGICPARLSMGTTYNGEFFRGSAIKEADLNFWARYRFIAYNLGGLGGIEMAGFFYISKLDCYLHDTGYFMVVSPVIEYYGPPRDRGGGAMNEHDPGDHEYIYIDGVRFSCYRYTTDDGLRVLRCTAEA